MYFFLLSLHVDMEPVILDEHVTSGKIHWSQSKDLILFFLEEKQCVGFHFYQTFMSKLAQAAGYFISSVI